MPRLNTQLESEAAEFFVLATLLLNKVPSFKNYTKHSDYDLIATNLDNNRLAKIQVKSRYRKGATGFPIKNFNSDFVVYCRLNRSIKGDILDDDPEYWIFPTKVVLEGINTTSTWQKFYINQVPNLDKYYMNWELIKKYLGIKGPMLV
jgi:hypothetical protein